MPYPVIPNLEYDNELIKIVFLLGKTDLYVVVRLGTYRLHGNYYTPSDILMRDTFSGKISNACLDSYCRCLVINDTFTECCGKHDMAVYKLYQKGGNPI